MESKITFEQAHPDTAAIIEERGYETHRYEGYVDSKLQEVWEKDEQGVWQRIWVRGDSSDKHHAEMRELEAVQKQLAELKAFLQQHGVDVED